MQCACFISRDPIARPRTFPPFATGPESELNRGHVDSAAIFICRVFFIYTFSYVLSAFAFPPSFFRFPIICPAVATTASAVAATALIHGDACIDGDS